MLVPGRTSFMQENTEPEKLEDPNSLDREENFPDTEEEPLPENLELELSESDPQLEEQEVLPLDEKKKSGTGKIFLFLVLVLAGSGGYLYFNNLIPAEILNLISPKQATSPALVAIMPPTPLPVEVVEPESPSTTPVLPETSEMLVISPEPPPVPPTLPETPKTHISGGPVESPARISGNNFAQIPETKEEKYSPETASAAEPQTMVPAIEEPPEPPPIVKRNESVQAYIDFIESSVQKLGELIKKGFNLGRDYLRKQLG